MSRYVKEQRKFTDSGIQLHTPPDLVPATQYTRINNVLPKSEGELRTRDGLTSIATILASSDVHTIFRLNQEVPSVVNERIFGADQRIFTTELPAGTTITERTDLTFDGNKLSIITFRFTNDQASWAIIANSAGMRKYRGGAGTGYYQKLGITPPLTAATAVDGGSGNLNSTGGTEYDWRYTYLNGVTNSESNPSDIALTAGSSDAKRPTANTNPDTDFGGTAFTNPANARDGDSSTFATGSAASATETRLSCLWLTWATTGGTETALFLKVSAEFIGGGTSGTCLGTIYYTLDGGTTWKTLMTANGTKAKKTYSAPIPIGTAFADIQVRAVVFGSGAINLSPASIFGRGFAKVGGNLIEIDLIDEGVLVGGGGNKTLELRVYDIRTDSTLSTATDSTLALVNKKALVFVEAPTDTQVTAIRLYRRGGTLPNEWNRVGTFALSENPVGIISGIPGTAAGNDWPEASGTAGPDNAKLSNNKRAWFDDTTQVDLRMTNFGLAIPNGATIRGIEVQIEGNAASGTAAQRQIRVGLTKDGTALAGSRKTGVELNEDIMTPLVTSTANIGTGRTIGNNTLSMVVDAHAGQYVRITGAFAEGEMRLIASNTATLLTYDADEPDLAFGFDDPFEVVPAGTDTTNIEGGASDLWGTTWTEAEIEASTFGVLISDNDATAAEIRIDAVTVIIYANGLEDDVGDTSLGSTLELDNDVPVSSVEVLERPLPRVWGPFDERVLGCGDPDRPESVYFSKRGQADQWPPQNHIETGDPGEALVNGVIYNTRSFAFSKERMFELVPNIVSGVSFSPFPTPCGRGLIAPFGLVVSDAIYFVAKDGVYLTTGGEEQSLVDNDIKPLFPTQSGPGRDVSGYEAVDFAFLEDIELEWHNDELYFTYRGVTSGDRQTLIYDLVRRRWRAATWSPEVVTVHSEGSTVSSLLMGSTTGLYYTASGNDDQGTAITASLRTGSHDQGFPLNTKQYGVLLVDCNPGGATVIVTPHINGEASSLAPTNLTGSTRQIFTVDLLETEARNISFDFSWAKTSAQTPILYQYEILYFMLPVATTHWASDETSFGLQGWLHLRDLYVTIKSTAAVTLTLDFDGTTQTYTIASTAGVRKKVYVQLAPNKGKLYKFEFNSSAAFNLFEGASEIRVKQWLTSLGYQTLPAFGGEQLERTIAV